MRDLLRAISIILSEANDEAETRFEQLANNLIDRYAECLAQIISAITPPTDEEVLACIANYTIDIIN